VKINMKSLPSKRKVIKLKNPEERLLARAKMTILKWMNKEILAQISTKNIRPVVGNMIRKTFKPQVLVVHVEEGSQISTRLLTQFKNKGYAQITTCL
jgi:hypothetical protein